MIPDANAIPEAEARRPLVVVVVARIRLWFRFREYRGRQMQFILVKRNALPPPRGDQGPSHPTQNVTKALFGLILWRNDGWIPFLLRTLLCLCREYEMSTRCYVQCGRTHGWTVKSKCVLQKEIQLDLIHNSGINASILVSAIRPTSALLLAVHCLVAA